MEISSVEIKEREETIVVPLYGRRRGGYRWVYEL
jgi:hypothetical protein